MIYKNTELYQWLRIYTHYKIKSFWCGSYA